MRSTKVLLAAGLTSVLASLNACGSSSGGTDDGSFTLHAVVALSGPAAAAGEAQKFGFEAAKAVINANGGVSGKPIDIEYIDSASLPTEAVTRVQQLLSEGKIEALSPGSTSSEITAVLPVAAGQNVFQVTYGAGLNPEFYDPSKNPNVFAVTIQPSDQAASIVDQLGRHGFKKVGILTTDNVAGKASSGALEAAADKAGLSTEAAFIPETAVDATGQLEQLLATAPDVLVIDIYGAAAGPALAARAKLGVNLPTYGSQMLTASNLAEVASPSDLEGILLQSYSSQVAGTEIVESDAFKTFHEELLKAIGGEPTFAMNTYAVPYNTAILAAAAAEMADSDDASALVEAVEGAGPDDLKFFVGPKDYSADRHKPTFGPEVWSFVPYSPIKGGLITPGS